MCISDRVLCSRGLLQTCCNSVQAGLEFAIIRECAFLVLASLPRWCGRSLRLVRAKHNTRLRSGSPFQQMPTGFFLNLRSELLPRPLHCSAGPAPHTQSVSFPLGLAASSKSLWSFRKAVICVWIWSLTFSLPVFPTFSSKWVRFFVLFFIFIKTRVTVKTEKLFAFPGWYKPVYSFKEHRLRGSFSQQHFIKKIILFQLYFLLIWMWVCFLSQAW